MTHTLLASINVINPLVLNGGIATCLLLGIFAVVLLKKRKRSLFKSFVAGALVSVFAIYLWAARLQVQHEYRFVATLVSTQEATRILSESTSEPVAIDTERYAYYKITGTNDQMLEVPNAHERNRTEHSIYALEFPEQITVVAVGFYDWGFLSRWTYKSIEGIELNEPARPYRVTWKLFPRNALVPHRRLP